MAIAKVKNRKLEITPQAMIELAIAGGLVITSLIFVYLGVNRWLLKRSITKALTLHDQNNPGLVAEECRSALRKDGKYHLARQLLAKALIDEGGKDPAKLAEAEKEYQELIAAGYDKPNAHVGLGVISLIRADQASDSKQYTDHANKARASFDAARKMDATCIEAEIGMANVRLLLAIKAGGDLADARKDFERIRTKLEASQDLRSKVTKEGLIDLYAGLARTMSGTGNWNEASRLYRICFLYAPEWELPLVNLAYTDAERYANGTFTREQLDNDQTLKNFTMQLQNMALKSELLKEVHAVRELGISVACGHAEHVEEMQSRIQRLESTYPGRYDILYTRCYIWLTLARKTEPFKGPRLRYASEAATALKLLLDTNEMKDAARTAERLVILNATAAMLEATSLESRSDTQLYEAEKLLRAAIELDKEGAHAYVLWRNLAAVLKRMSAYQLRNYTPDQIKAAIEEALTKAGAAPGADVADLAKIKAWNP